MLNDLDGNRMIGRPQYESNRSHLLRFPPSFLHIPHRMPATTTRGTSTIANCARNNLLRGTREPTLLREPSHCRNRPDPPRPTPLPASHPNLPLGHAAHQHTRHEGRLRGEVRRRIQ